MHSSFIETTEKERPMPDHTFSNKVVFCTRKQNFTSILWSGEFLFLQNKIEPLIKRIEKSASQSMEREVRVDCYIEILENLVFYWSLGCPNVRFLMFAAEMNLDHTRLHTGHLQQN